MLYCSLVTGECIKLKESVQADLVQALKTKAVLQVQEGSLDFTLVGVDDTIDCDNKKCAYSNPKSPYGLVTLPLSRKEDLTKKLNGTYDLPDWSISNLDGSQGWERGLSPSWQLRHDELVMVFGCTPPAQTSRYFAVTGYIYDLYSQMKSDWVSVFGSLGDSKSIVRVPEGGVGSKNRLKTFAPGSEDPSSIFEKEVDASRSSGFGELTLVLMGASRSGLEGSQRVVRAVLDKHKLGDIVNLIPIAKEFGEIGLANEDDSHFSYYTMILRNILAKDSLPWFREYTDQSPLSAWRMTPVVMTTTPVSPSDRFSVEDTGIIPRSPSGGMVRNEAEFTPALEKLIENVEKKYGGEHVVAHAFGAASSLGLMNIEWGLDCVAGETDFCNGDNRDALYLSTYPLLTLDTADNFAYVVGINHRVANMTMYNSIAVSDPIARMGVASVDDEEIYGSAEEFLKDTEFKSIHHNLYAIRFSRDCRGMKYCTEIPSEGGRKVALDTQILVAQRLYVNPLTGVGPSSEDVLMPHTMMFTPTTIKDADKYKRGRIDPKKIKTSPCMLSFIKLPTCVSDLGEACCDAVTTWTNNGCFCDKEVGEPLLQTLPENFGVREFKALSLYCGVIPLCDMNIQKIEG